MSENPPAFPNTGNSTWQLDPNAGMTMRDWFAGQVIGVALRIAFESVDHPAREDLLPEEWAAKIALGVADAMLKERGNAD